MSFKKRFASLFSKIFPKKSAAHHKKKGRFSWFKTQHASGNDIAHSHRRRKLILLFGKALALVLLLFSVGAASAQAPTIEAAIAKLIPVPTPKPISQSAKTLSVSTQQAIEALAQEEIKNAKAQELVSTVTSGDQSQPVNTSASTDFTIFQAAQETISGLTASDPAVKAKIKLARISRKITQLEQLLTTGGSDRTINQVVTLIAEIGQQTDEVSQSPVAHTDRDVLTTQIEEYNRLQLLVQKGEEALPLAAYLKVEAARQKYLVATAITSINAAPNLEAVHNIGVGEIKKIVGADFAQLKTIEVISDFKGSVTPEAQQKLTGLEKQLGLEFEKRMLKQPPEVRMRKLNDYIQLSYSNPVLQIQSFDGMKRILTDREMILGIETLKELAIKKLEKRIFEIDSPQLRDQFVQTTFNKPQDLEVLAQVRLDVDAGFDETKKQQVSDLEERSYTQLVSDFDTVAKLNTYYAPELAEHTNILDTTISSRLAKALEKSPTVSSEVKAASQTLHQKILQNFVAGIRQNNFLTTSKLSYNPVSDNADVRLLLPVPRALPLLVEIKSQLPLQDGAIIATAERVSAVLIADHVIFQVSDPTLLSEYQDRIENNPAVKQLMQTYVGGGFFTDLNQKEGVVAAQGKKDEQALYEKMQQITQQIFAAPDGKITDTEKQLSTEVQIEINKLRQELPAHNVPKLATPQGVMLPEVAKLPDDVSLAIVEVARREIADRKESTLAKLDLTVTAKDLGVSEPAILPDNVLYPIIEIVREIPVLLTQDPVDKAEKQLRIDNERTLEAEKLLEGSQSQQTVTLALSTLDKINQDFDLLKAHVDDLKKEEPAKVDTLVDQIIENGLARQTVLSSIEAKIYGDDYVQVEADRQAVLKNGVDVLLTLTNQDAQKLTDKLELVIENAAGSDLRDIKAVELLTEIERTQPAPVQQILEKAQESLAQNLETKLLAMPKEERTQAVLDYAQSAPGNPIRQFEAYETLKDDFKNPETIALVEGLKDKAVENLTQKISEITDARGRQEFVDAVLGGEPQDLKIVMEIAERVAPPENFIAGETVPIVEKIQDIKAEVEQNIIDTYIDKPEELLKTDFYQSATVNATVDITDVTVAAELREVFSRSPEVSADVVTVARQEEVKIINTLLEDISKPEFQASGIGISKLAEETLDPAPQMLAALVDLRNEVPPSEQAKIDRAIQVEVDVIQEHLTTEINDPATFQTYVAEIIQNPVVEAVVVQTGGIAFTQAVETKAQEIQTTATAEQKTLEKKVAQVQQEIFSAPLNNPSALEQSLPAIVQKEIREVKQEVPVAQVPAVTVAAAVNVTTTIAPAPAAPEPVSAPAQEAPAAPVGL